MAELCLKPARAGDIIRDPASGKIMPPEGEAKPRNIHWLRRLERKEVVPTTAEAVAAGKAEREKAEREKAEREAATAEETAPAPAAESDPAEPTGKTRKAKE